MDFILELITLALAILGTFFQGVRQDRDGKTLRNKHGLPIPTATGWVIVSLLVIASGGKIYLSRRADAAAETERKAAQSQIEALQNKLLEARDEITTNIKKATDEDSQSFQSLMGTQLREGQKTIQELQAASSDLQRAANQTEIMLPSFAVTVFFSPVSETLGNSSYVNGPSFDRQIRAVDENEAEEMFCSSPVPISNSYIKIPLTSFPRLLLTISFQGIADGKCKIHALLDRSMLAETDADFRSFTADVPGVFVFKNGVRAAITVFVAVADLHKLQIQDGIRLSQFGPSISADISAITGREPVPFSTVRPYLEGIRPSILGVNIDGSEVDSPNDNLVKTWVFTSVQDSKFNPQTGGFNGFYLLRPHLVTHWTLGQYLGLSK
jgi:hypothetical protein